MNQNCCLVAFILAAILEPLYIWPVSASCSKSNLVSFHRRHIPSPGVKHFSTYSLNCLLLWFLFLFYLFNYLLGRSLTIPKSGHTTLWYLSAYPIKSFKSVSHLGITVFDSLLFIYIYFSSGEDFRMLVNYLISRVS